MNISSRNLCNYLQLLLVVHLPCTQLLILHSVILCDYKYLTCTASQSVKVIFKSIKLIEYLLLNPNSHKDYITIYMYV